MKLGILFERALYRELRSSIGYYDARRIIRSIEKNSEKLTDVDNLVHVLHEIGFDQRQIRLTVEIVRKHSSLLRKEQVPISIDRPTLNTLTAPLSVIAEKEHGITWLKENMHKN